MLIKIFQWLLSTSARDAHCTSLTILHCCGRDSIIIHLFNDWIKTDASLSGWSSLSKSNLLGSGNNKDAKNGLKTGWKSTSSSKISTFYLQFNSSQKKNHQVKTRAFEYSYPPFDLPFFNKNYLKHQPFFFSFPNVLNRWMFVSQPNKTIVQKENDNQPIAKIMTRSSSWHFFKRQRWINTQNTKLRTWKNSKVDMMYYFNLSIGHSK